MNKPNSVYYLIRSQHVILFPNENAIRVNLPWAAELVMTKKNFGSEHVVHVMGVLCHTVSSLGFRRRQIHVYITSPQAKRRSKLGKSTKDKPRRVKYMEKTARSMPSVALMIFFASAQSPRREGILATFGYLQNAW